MSRESSVQSKGEIEDEKEAAPPTVDIDQTAFISRLPEELILLICSLLEPKDLLSVTQTCRYWRDIAEDNFLWREKCTGAGITLVSPTTPWKAAFMRKHRIEMNWRVKPIRPFKELIGHGPYSITCHLFSGNLIVTGSDDRTLKVWSATTGECLRTLVGHTAEVCSSDMIGNRIISGSRDRSLRVWDAETGRCIHTLRGHGSMVTCMHLFGSFVVSGSWDATLRMWDIETGECIRVLVGHLFAISCVKYDGHLVVSSAFDDMIKVWDHNGECIYTLMGSTDHINALQFDGLHIVSGSRDRVHVWEVATGQCLHVFVVEGYKSEIFRYPTVEFSNNIIVSADKNFAKAWDILSGRCLNTFSGHSHFVTGIQFNSKFVITSSMDGTVKLWDIKTGQFIRNLIVPDNGRRSVWGIRANETKLVCFTSSHLSAVRKKLLVIDFDDQC